MAKTVDKRLGGIGSDAVRKATGKDWSQWLRAIDKTGGADLTHQQIANHLHTECGLSGWWAQMVTVGYEQARGRRVAHQKPNGFSVSASRTLAVPVARAYSAWKQKRNRDRWLGDHVLVIRTSTEHKSLRIVWTADDTRLDVNFYSKGDEKCQVAVQHEKLPNAKSAEQRKRFWRERMDSLKRHLEG